MTIFFMDGFSDRTTANIGGHYDTSSGGGTIGISSGLGGAKGALVGTGTPHVLYKNIGSNLSTIYFGMRFSKDAAAQSAFLELWDVATRQFYFTLNAIGTITAVLPGVGDLGTTSISIPQNTYTWVDGKVVFDGAAGAVVVRINGAVALNLTGIDTVAYTNAYCNIFGGNIGTQTIDMWVWADSAGGQTYIPELKIATLLPTAAGNSAQFTPLASTNVSQVQDPTSSAPCPDGDTSYNASSTAGHIDSFALANLTGSIGTIYAVQLGTYARKDDAGARTGAGLLRINGTNYAGATFSPGTGYAYNDAIWTVNPDTSAAFIPADIDAMEAGYKVVA